MGPRPEGSPEGGSGFSAFRSVPFRWLYFSNLSFFLAMGSQQIVRGWLVFELTDSKLALGTIMFTVAVPMLLVGPFGGVVADRRERRSLIATGQAVVVASELVILSLLMSGELRFWHLVANAGVMGCVFPYIMPARQAIVVNIVGKSGLANAMALNMAGMNATRVIGPAAGGLLIAYAGLEYAYMVGIALYAGALLCVWRVGRSPPLAEARDLSVRQNIVDGFTYIRQNRLVLLLLLYGLIPMFLAMPFQTLLVVFAKDIWHTGSTGFGILSGMAGVGGVAGSMWVAWRSDSQRRARAMLISMLGFGGFLLLFSLSPWFLLALPLVFAANVFQSIYGTLNNTAIQLLIPDHVRGRISSFLMMSFSLPMLGTLPMSGVAEIYGAPFAVGLASCLAIAVAVLFFVTSSELRNMDASVRRAMLE